ncbi:methylated-DNA--[protein]-cysteine S-methyltransferase [Lapidilactobacillus mulanensis]|uniref:Methylated-DNA--[protein]-cysteine S-methyltransferase n=1 Tax=Lapidilactobacillus mulanensis TaxID=2485999 RepID=A0ABW4DN69_9LACO|nr:methylated-DNA--[protein]-cysteine S-methyltransferase [Lapidilactobacillus mulanensis]
MNLYFDQVKIQNHHFLIIVAEDGLQFVSLTENGWDEYEQLFPKALKQNTYTRRPAKIKPYKKALQAYFNGRNHLDQLPISAELGGTELQQQVWDALQKLPAGQTMNYSELATEIGQPKSFRAVASAVAKNPVGIFIPCHRVLRKDGGLGDFRGGLNFKRELLSLEKRTV